MELLIILGLIVLNGIFSMSEAAIIASRKSRLHQQAEKGNKGAQTALKLADDPNRFLSTVQIGITLIGIMTGAIGGAALEHQFARLLVDTPFAPYSDVISFTMIVLLTTYLSLIIGELVPKRLALRAPEAMAMRVARPMNLLARLTAPIVSLLSASTEALLWVLRARHTDEAPITEDEITGMVKQGIEAGVFQETAHDMVEGVFSLSDRRNSALMTPRTEVLWLNIQDDIGLIRDELIKGDHSRFPVCAGDLDHVLGVVHSKNVMDHLLLGKPLDVQALMQPALTVPASAPVTRTLELFRENKGHFALVIGEYGETLGIITLQDVLEEIVGEVETSAEPEIVRRDDGSYLLDGLLPIDEFGDLFAVEDIPGAHKVFETLGGFIMALRDEIPKAGDQLTWGTLRIEVIDMDGNRVDKVLVSTLEAAPKDEADG
ncbi:MAG: HlyC/CorC family transporter [Anaerolineae bacterium]|nr:HlyC/CorC family transporter [Anaerolineae bacterium]